MRDNTGRIRVTALAGLVPLVLPSACEPPRSTDDAPFTVQDSAGVEMATSTAPAASEGQNGPSVQTRSWCSVPRIPLPFTGSRGWQGFRTTAWLC